MLESFGAKPQYAETDIHEHNGSAEKVIWTLEIKLQALGFPKCFWDELVPTAVWIYNRTAHSGIQIKTPYELYFQKQLNLEYARIIGSRCYVYKPKIPRGKKRKPRAEVKYLAGYTFTGYRVYDPISKLFIDECIMMIDEDNQYKHDYPSHSSVSQILFPKRDQSNIVNPQTGGGQSLQDKKIGGSVSQSENPLLIPTKMITRSSNQHKSKIEPLVLNPEVSVR